ncbi:hypothetical protein [Eubacterium limosum]|uniref:hypothetical protein n=1 Tax=Eubacterium limosum TaxID=1736 RepID=UPI0022DF57A9|nr:hypothetical protein [Eubacterium limosum]
MRHRKALKIFTLLFAAMWTLSAMSPVFAEPENNEITGGPVTDYIVTKIADESIEIIDGWVVSGLYYAADKTGVNFFSTMGDLLTFPSGKDTSQILKLCQEMKGELDALQEEMDAISDKLDVLVGGLEKLINENIWYNNRREYSEIMSKYESAYTDYTNYLDASQKYTKALEDGDAETMDSEMHKMNRYLVNFTENFDPTKTGDPISFKSDLRRMAMYACRYYPSYDRSKPNPVLSPTNSITLLDNAKRVTDQTVAFEHQQCDVLLQQMDECIQPFIYMSMVNHIWVEYNVSANVDTNTLDKLMTEQETVINETVQAINDISSQGKTYTDRLMRSYDAEIDLPLRYETSSIEHMKGKGLWPNLYYRPHDIVRSASWTKPEMPAYQMKALGAAYPFVLLKEGNAFGYLTHDALFKLDQEYVHHASGGKVDHFEYSTVSQDFLNLEYSADYNYTGISQASSLRYLLNTPAYRLSGQSSIVDYLVNYGGIKAEHLPQGVDYAVINKWDSAADHTSIEGGVKVNGSWCCTYYYIDGLTGYRLDDSDSKINKRVKSMVASEEHFKEELRGISLLSFMTGNSLPRYMAKAESAKGTVVRLFDENGYDLNGSSFASHPVTLTVDCSGLAENERVQSVELLDSKGKVLDTLLTADAFEYFKKKDNTIKFSFTAPYQNYTVRATTGKKTEETTPVINERGSIVKMDVQSGPKEIVPTDIYTFEDLKRVAKAVAEEPETYAHANFTVMNDIDADGEEWVLPIGTAVNAYNGTFNGKGHSISGMTADGNGLQGLFGRVGPQGVVKNLRIFDTDIRSGTAYAGAVAAINEGRIEYCQAGAGHLLTDNADAPDLDDMNIHIESGTAAGGIAGKNSGVIINTSSAGRVSAQIAGGLAGENSGEIRNSFGTVIADIEGILYTGGIAGNNEGTMRNVYFGGHASGGADGAIAGRNISETLDACYYDNSMDDASGEGNATAQSVPVGEMKTDTFKDQLNSRVTEGAYYWHRDDKINLGLPYINQNTYSSRILEDPATGISLTGEQIHAAAVLTITPIEASSPDYQSLLEKNSGLLGLYDISLTTPTGDVPFEGTLDLAFPFTDKETDKIGILHQSSENSEIYTAKMDSDGRYHVVTNHLSLFGIVSITSGSGALLPVALLTALAAAFTVVYLIRRKKLDKQRKSL